MFEKKYIFETEQTKMSRNLKNIAITLILVFSLYIFSGVAFILIAQNESNRSVESLYKKNPDLVVVFTGDYGRIPFAFKKAKEYQQNNLFISGVYAKNSVNTLIQKLTLQDDFNPDLIKIDYLARNTVENVFATFRFLKEQKHFKSILIAGHDYHIVRIRHIINKLKSPNDDYKFYYSGLSTDYSKWRNIKILYKEVYKFAKAFLFLLLWDSEIDSTQFSGPF